MMKLMIVVYLSVITSNLNFFSGGRSVCALASEKCSTQLKTNFVETVFCVYRFLGRLSVARKGSNLVIRPVMAVRVSFTVPTYV